MRTLALRALVAGAAVLLAHPAIAQAPRGGGRGGFGGFGGPGGDPALLLLNKSVQDELKLTDDQKADLKKVQDKMRETMQKAFTPGGGGDPDKAREAMQTVVGETKKEIEKWQVALKPDQAKRLKQIQYQLGGIKAFANSDVQKEMSFTDKQKTDVKDISEGFTKDTEEVAGEMRQARGNREKQQEIRKKIEALNKEAMEKVNGVLTEDQKKTWKEMQGEKFEFKPDRGPGGQGGGGRNRQAQPSNNQAK